jgi:hypothetical protein
MKFTFALNWWLVLQLFILPVLLPLLVGLVTKYSTSSRAKAILLLALSIITALLTNILAAQQSGQAEFDLGLALLTAFVTFVFGVGVHLGLLKPVGATEAVQSTGNHDKVLPPATE